MKKWIPNQHGAWAMLITPVVVGALLGGVRRPHLLLLLSWLAAYCANFFLMLALKTRKWDRYRKQLLTYGGCTVVGGAPLTVVEPQLLRLAFVAIPALAVNLYFVQTRNERAWLNDVTGILLAGAVGFAAFRLGYRGSDAEIIDAAWRGIAIVCLYFVGTVFYVKTIIRERGDRRWFAMSVLFHVGFALLLIVSQFWLLSAIAATALVRALVVPSLGWTPKRVGLVEIAFTVAFGLAVLPLS